ncbi:MAG: phospholipase D-like domain-containing protein [Anaerobutyricum sp.]
MINEVCYGFNPCSKRGVDVRIITPGIPDKKMIFLVTQSYYPQLVEGGVQIFQYRPGFVHAKCAVCDDKIATVRNN